MMSMFSTTPSAEQKVQSLPAILIKPTREQFVNAIKHLTYAVPGMYTKGPISRAKKSKGKRRRNTGEGLYFPNPEIASRLNKVYHIFQEFSGGAAASSTTIDAVGALNFQYSSNTQEAQLSAVFDQYRIAMVEVTFMPRVNLVTFSNTPPVFHSAVDLDDSSTTTVASIVNYSGCQVTEAYAQHKHTFVPHVAIAAYSGAFTSFANEPAPWIDVASPSVQHYGVKWAFTTTSQVYTYDIKVRVHFQFKNVR